MKAIITICVIITLNLVTNAQNAALAEITNLLSIRVDGGEYGFRDETFIHFAEGATTAYDEEIDAKKWWSLDPEATMIWTVTSDYINVAINNLPLSDLHTITNTVPLHFVCGYNGGEYLLRFGDLESFDTGIELWLEDTETEEGWIQVTETDTIYSFTGIPDHPSGRFLMHIFDPLMVDVDETTVTEEPLEVYAAGNTIYIKNATEEEIRQIKIYNINGQQAKHTINYASQELVRARVDGPAGFYIVRLLGEKHVYTKKIFMKNF